MALLLLATSLLGQPAGAARPAPATSVTVDSRPNIFVYNLDDLRDAVPGGVDPLDFMPEVRAWMADGTRYANSFVVDPACCPSRASLMTGRYPHNNGVRLQAHGPNLDWRHSMACYLRDAGYATYLDGKFLTTWPKTEVPPCFHHSTVMWSGYNNVKVKVDGVDRTARGYSTTYLGNRGRVYIDEALQAGTPFLLYEAPQAPHWVKVTNPDGTTSRLAVPDAPYRDANVGDCAGRLESDRSDKPPYVRWRNETIEQGQAMCASQLRAIMSADDQFGATMQLLADRGVLDTTLVIFTSDNGYMWSEHGRTEKFVPYEPSVRVPLLVRWPGHIPAGVDATRLVSYLDLLPTLLGAAGAMPAPGSPPLDGESLLARAARSTFFAEYYSDPANGKVPSWKMVRTRSVKYVQTYDSSGAVTFREYYDLDADPAELVNLLKDGNAANDPPPSEVDRLATQLDGFATCQGSACVVG
jgi:arylsulfatase A-like enzyme